MSSHNIYEIRQWMYNRIDEETGEISNDFKEGLKMFMQFATNQEISREQGKISCHCIKCGNEKFISIETVWKHVFLRGFTPGYYIWFSHGEDFETLPSSSSESRGFMVDGRTAEVDRSAGSLVNRENDRVVEMVTDAFRETVRTENSVEEPNVEAKRFYDMLEAARIPIYSGCKEGQSALSAASRLMSIKTEWNLPEDCVDAIADFAKDYMPADNIAPGSYYAIQKLVSGLDLPYEMIDVCRENCMIFWREDANLDVCRFCGQYRFQDLFGKTKIPYQRMWYLPVSDRLKKLYQFERTVGAMRWHDEHEFNGKKRYCLTGREYDHLHNYILRNCEDILPFERIFEDQIHGEYGLISEADMEKLKSEKFAKWLQYYVKSMPHPSLGDYTWLLELIVDPLSQAISSPMYCTRGYVFRKRPGTNNRKTVNHGVVVRTETVDYYGEINDIIEVEYPGLLNMKCILFKCDWYDPTVGHGVRTTKFGVTEIHTGRRLRKFDPFILASQADQVTYIPYPRVGVRNNPWVIVTQINPRGRVYGVHEKDPLQQDVFTMTEPTLHSLEEIPLVNGEDDFPEDGFDDMSEEDSGGEFGNDGESSSSQMSTDDSD